MPHTHHILNSLLSSSTHWERIVNLALKLFMDWLRDPIMSLKALEVVSILDQRCPKLDLIPNNCVSNCQPDVFSLIACSAQVPYQSTLLQFSAITEVFDYLRCCSSFSHFSWYYSFRYFLSLYTEEMQKEWLPSACKIICQHMTFPRPKQLTGVERILVQNNESTDGCIWFLDR